MQGAQDAVYTECSRIDNAGEEQGWSGRPLAENVAGSCSPETENHYLEVWSRCRTNTMKTKLLHNDNGLKTFALVFQKDEDVREPLLAFAREQGISGAHLSAIGAFSEVTLGYFDRHKKAYQEIPVHEQVEVLAFTGNLARHEDNCILHAHVVVGRADGSAAGGHFLRGKVWPTLEMVLAETPQSLRRVRDEETGLPLIDLSL